MTRPLRSSALAVAALAVSPSACAADAGRGPDPATAEQTATTARIRVDVEGKRIPATLDDCATARDFATLLPLELTLADYGSTEKIAELPRRLTTDDAPPGVAPATGDLAYYAPWGNLAIFLEDFRASSGLVRLGRIESGLEVLRRPGPLRVRIERVEKRKERSRK